MSREVKCRAERGYRVRKRRRRQLTKTSRSGHWQEPDSLAELDRKLASPWQTYALLAVFGTILTLSLWTHPPHRFDPAGIPGGISEEARRGASNGAENNEREPGFLWGVIVAVDPGHGGMDPGAIGPSDSYEKDITLAIAQYLEELLIADDARVIMTRTEDIFISRSGRASIANEHHAHVLISIHANTYETPDVGGTETYFWSNHPESERLAGLVQVQVVEQLGRKDRGVRKESFVVLRQAEMPAILLECLYLSSPEEERLLLRGSTQRAIARGIHCALIEFFTPEA